ncbi:hypothetical protein DM02DRAFT_610516 [Periconia macrospinosa]|uniref:SH3 domain-containing protein n=1 Tax=Periconia macrospinosa TaxID=97972 RepID=A0A2V1E5U5_9PLEO|nr:hypothetical protein DM02DRAFT_610516 [Periconia macrospinosa]
MPHFKVKAVYKYESPHEDDLSFNDGQIITVTEVEDDDWYVGEYIDDSGTKHDGLFPQNFVEKYEPELPARPNRASRYKPLEQQAPQPAPPTPEVPQHESAPVPPAQEDEVPKPPQSPPPVEISQNPSSQVTSPTSPVSARSGALKSPELPQEPPAAPKPSAPEPASAAPAKKAPPPVAAKNSAFLNRIAAFNAPAAAPIQPFKPGGQPSTFVKKPFVAPPPSRNAYVPPPREAPQVKTYRRDEDPEVAERQAQDQESAERAGLAGNTTSNDGDGEEQAPTVSLKERIARLQKEQQEQAARAAALAKEKPKRPPPKKRAESHEARGDEGEGALDRSMTSDSRERTSAEHARPPRSAHGLQSPDQTNRDIMSDANDADQSGAGETEDADGTSTSVEEEDERAKQKFVPRAPAAPSKEPDVGDEQDVEEEEEEEEDEEAAEARRKLELRERMARIGGGYGMPGMFGGGLPMGVPPPKKKKPEKKPTADSEEYSMPQQRIPMFGLPGVKSPEIENKTLAVEKEEEEPRSAISQSRPADEVPDVEDVAPQPAHKTPTAERSPPFSPESKHHLIKNVIPEKPIHSSIIRKTIGAFRSSSSANVSKTYVTFDGFSEYVMTVCVSSMSSSGRCEFKC